MESRQTTDYILDECEPLSCDPQRRRSIALVASVAAHAAILVALVFLLPEVERPHHDWVLAYLVEFDRPGIPGREAGASDARASFPPAAAHDEASAASSPRPHHAHRRAANVEAKPPRRAARQSAAIAAAPVPGAAAMAAGSEVASAPPMRLDAPGSGSGGGADTRGGSGSSFAHVEYGRNPFPEYPSDARRRAREGTVMLRVQVESDGSVRRVQLARSSGIEALDDSAIETVRTRWRFIPAVRDGVAIASWVEVPIRFELTDARQN